MEEVKENKNTLDITPLGKIKRCLLFLGDYFLIFIISFLLMNVAVYPLSTAIVKMDNLNETVETYEKGRYDILYGNELLFYETDSTKYSYEDNLYYTYDLFLYNYINFSDKKTDVCYKYYNDIAKTPSIYIEYFTEYNNKDSYFVVNGDTITINEDVKTTLYNGFEEANYTSDWKKIYNNGYNHLFMPLYGSVLNDIAKKDLSFNGISYVNCLNYVEKNQSIINWDYTICSLISYLFGWGIIYLFVPMLHKTRATPTGAIAKFERVGFDNLDTLSRGETALIAVQNMVFNLSSVILLPMWRLKVVYVFNLPLLQVLSIISLLFAIISFIITLFNSFNRTLSDILTKSVIITTDDLENVYRARGYTL